MKLLPRMLLAGVAWVTLGAQALPAETPEQHFFDWSDLQFSKEAHAGRRAALTAALAETRPIFLAPSRDGFSSGETFRQLDDFLYFTGLEFPNSVLAIDADSGKSILFAPEWDARFANPSRRNDLPGRKLALDPKLAEHSGIDDIRSIGELDAALEKWVAAGRRLALGLSTRQALERAEIKLLQELSPTQAFHQRLLDRFPAAVIDPAFDQVAILRMIKGPEEIALLRRAAEITSSGIRAAAATLRSLRNTTSSPASSPQRCAGVSSGTFATWTRPFLVSHSAPMKPSRAGFGSRRPRFGRSGRTSRILYPDRAHPPNL